MKVVNDIWRQLVGRRLLPVAILLLAALAAVPIALAEDSADAPEPKLQPVDAEAAAATKTIVSVATETGARRRVLGAKENPFLGQKLPKPEEASKADADGGATGSGDETDTPASGGSGGSSTGGATTPPSGAGPAPSPGTSPDPAEPERTYAVNELTVRFGEASGDPARGSVKVREALPSSEEPVLIYLGLTRDAKRAIFLIDENVTAEGDGVCLPTPEACETVRLKPGETEFFDVTDEAGEVTAQYQLDLVKIHRPTGAKAASSRSAASREDPTREHAGLVGDVALATASIR